MKNINLLLCLFATLFIFDCENQLYIETGIVWSDDTYFQADGDWYVALSEGCYPNCRGVIIDVIDQLPLLRGVNTTKRFVLGAGSEGNITAFVFLDRDGNGVYDDGYDNITGYKYNYSDTEETTQIAVSAFY